MLRSPFAPLALVLACVLPATACREPARRDAGTVDAGAGRKPGSTRANTRVAPRPSTEPCDYTPLRTVGTHASADSEMTLAFVSGHLGLAWTAADHGPLGTELRDNGAILRPITAIDTAPAHDGIAVQWVRAFPTLDPRSALAASLDIERQVDEASGEEDRETGSTIELRCGEVVDTPFFVTHAGSESANPGSMFACRTVGEVTPFVIGLASDRPDAGGASRSVRVFARRNALPAASSWDADRFADAVWSFPVEPMAERESSDVIDVWREAYEPDALVAVEAPGRGNLVAIAIQGRLYTGWLDARLGAATPLHRIREATHVTGASVAWNGYEALLVYTDEENGAARVFASRIAARSGPSAPVRIATTSAALNALRSPSVTASGGGEWAVAWIEANRVGDNALPGAARLQVLRTDLTPREAAHGWGGDGLDQVRVAARGENVVIAVLSRSGETPHVDIGSARCRSNGYVAPPPAVLAAEALPPIASPRPASAREADGGTACTALPRRAFHLRASPARASTGREMPPGVLTVLERGTLQRGDSTIHRVRTATGATGWMFLAPNELSSGCTLR